MSASLVRNARLVSASLVCALTAIVSAHAAAADPPPPAIASLAPAPASASWLDNVSVFVGPDGSKQPQDLGINATMGVRVAATAGAAISRRLHLGVEFGAGWNDAAAAVHVLDQLGSQSHREQTFLTAGVFDRPTARLVFALVYDVEREHYFDDFRLSQYRGTAAVRVTRSDEIGLWFTHGSHADDGTAGDTAVRLSPIAQANVFTRHTWATGAVTSIWLGVADGHHDVVLVFPDNAYSAHVLVWGAELFVPLSDRFALAGSANLVTPASTGTVDAFLGVTYFPGRSALRHASSVYAAPLDIANNPSFSVDLLRK